MEGLDGWERGRIRGAEVLGDGRMGGWEDRRMGGWGDWKRQKEQVK